MWLVGHDKDKRNPSTVDRSHQLTLTFLTQPTTEMANMQHPIIRPLVFREHGCQPIIQLTMGWLLGNISCWDNREHTLLSGFGHYLSTFKVISLFIPAYRNTDGDLQITQDTFYNIQKMGEDEAAAYNRWWWDVYLNLFFNDQLWANMIQGAKWLQQVDWTQINDPVLLSLLQMGILDWTGPNNCVRATAT